MANGRGLRLIDLIVSLLIFMFLWGLLMPSLNRAVDYAWIEKCEANLKTIGQAMSMYAMENHHQFPRTRWDPNSTTVQFYTKPEARDPFAADGPAPNDVTASLYLLARTQGLRPEVFFCPLARLGQNADLNPPNWTTRSNFSGPTELTYSMANPFPSPQAVSSGFHWDDRLTSEDPVLADMNPGTSALAVNWNSSADALTQANTRNHKGGVHQVVLFGDMHAAVVSSPFAGVGGDNIYTYGPVSASSGGTGVIGLATSADDAVLLPVATIDPGALTDPDTIDRRWNLFWNTVWYVVMGGIGLIFCVRVARTEQAKRAARFVFANQATRRLRKGLCPSCGYDLRATPDRCPECGKVREVRMEHLRR